MATYHVKFAGDHKLELIDEKTTSIRDTVVLVNSLGELSNEELLDLVDEINELTLNSAIEVYPADSYLTPFRITRLE